MLFYPLNLITEHQLPILEFIVNMLLYLLMTDPSQTTSLYNEHTHTHKKAKIHDNKLFTLPFHLSIGFHRQWWDYLSCFYTLIFICIHWAIASDQAEKQPKRKQYIRTNNDLIYFWLGLAVSSFLLMLFAQFLFFLLAQQQSICIWFQVRAADILPFTWNEWDNSFFVLRKIHRAVNNNSHAAYTKAQVEFFFQIRTHQTCYNWIAWF